jgi:hypothetical protein
VPFESHLRQLCEELANCSDEKQSLLLAQDLKFLLHERIQQLRDKTSALELIVDEHTKSEAAKG